MSLLFSSQLDRDAEIRRVEMLFAGLSASVIAALIGVFLCLLVLFETAGVALLKVWTGYMLSVLAARIVIRYMFSVSERRIETIRRWEWLYACGAFLTGLGWGALFGPLYPPATHPEAQLFVALMVVITAFAGTVFVALSNATFWLFIVPTLGPAVIHFAGGGGEQANWPVATACCVVVVVIVQRTLYRSTVRSLHDGTRAESLLAEQQAIFDSSPLGIAVTEDKRVVKCNMRLGELLGCRIQDIAGTRLEHHFADAAEVATFLDETLATLDRGQQAQGIYRMTRADGSGFWAELSGHRMPLGTRRSVWTIADVTPRIASETHARRIDPA